MPHTVWTRNHYRIACLCYFFLVTACALFFRSVRCPAGAPANAWHLPENVSFQEIQAAMAPWVMSGWRTENLDVLTDALRKVDAAGGFPRWMVEYGENLLRSCGRGGILFTGSLVDTNAAWYAQRVLHVRRDVVVIPLGLLDRPWFVRSVRSLHGIRPEDPPDVPYPAGLGGLDKAWAATRWFPDATLQSLSRLVADNRWRRPVYFSMDAPETLIRPAVGRLQVSGLAFRLMPAACRRLDPDRTFKVLSDPARFRAIALAPAMAETDAVLNHCVAAAKLLSSEGGIRPGSRRFKAVEESLFTMLKDRIVLRPGWAGDYLGTEAGKEPVS
jgi:hypothetical protein